MKKRRELFYNITDPIATIIAPLTFLLFVIWALYFFTTPTPSFFHLNSNAADIGIRPISNENFILGQSTKRIYLKEAPFIYDSKIYLPLEAIVLASGTEEENVVKEGNRIIIKNEKSNDIYFDLKEKTVTIGREKISLGNSLSVKNNETFLSADYVEKIFKMEVKKDGDMITIRYKLFPIPFD
ncbi:hypothetical protein TheetDRAFT_1544 [Thermoanaerobacter ethanolicus JW 200]|uniref:stalk domain-containing protein n=1 Tax=Thermoanaerobacter ethanolicus TaxID=1757 RepID=UPI000202E609|nr:hypothetical protein TheetDRAFT_1544 [Thermoanaerobacter ethanolicus JW 200]